MTVVSYPLGTPPAAIARGGDCRARDLTAGRNVFGGHYFATTSSCRISNGLLRVTVGASGAAPALTIAAYRGAVVIGDVYTDTYTDLYGGSYSVANWQDMGVLTIDSPSVSALLTAVAVGRRSHAECFILRLVVPLIGDAFVALRRGERQVHVMHGDNRVAPQVTTTRRLRWTASPSPTGTIAPGRVEEITPAIDGFPRYVGAEGPATANAGAFSMTTTAVTSASFGAGVGTSDDADTTADLFAQLFDASRPALVVA